MSNWDAEYDAQMLAADAGAGPSFLNRVRAASPDAPDPDIAMLAVDTGAHTDEPALDRLMRHWMNERHAPDILPAQEVLLASLLDHIRRQTQTVQLLRADPASSEEEHVRIMLAQTEVERVKFVVRSYQRTRLFKIERFARWLVATPEVQGRLTAAELEHAVTFAHITERHFYASVLQSLPEAQAQLEETPAFMPPMTTEPDKTQPVFVHALQDCPPIRLPDESSLTIEKDHISLMPYTVVEHLVARGEVELV